MPTERIFIKEELTLREYLEELPYNIYIRVTEWYLRKKGKTQQEINHYWDAKRVKWDFPQFAIVMFKEEIRSNYEPDIDTTKQYIYHGEIFQAPGHAIIQEFPYGAWYPMIHTCDLRMSTDEEF